jgi:hypothetical protein
MIQVQVKQIWNDKDKRRVGRTFEVVNTDDTFAYCQSISNGKKRKTKVRLNRFSPKYYELHSTVMTPMSDVTLISADDIAIDSTTALHVDCASIMQGNWGGFGKFAVLDTDNVGITVREVKDNSYDIKVRVSGHLVYSNASRADLTSNLTQVRDFLKSVKDNISDMVG